MSVYLDTITLTLALFALLIHSQQLAQRFNFISVITFVITSSYLLAQSSWTTAWLLGDVWGRDFANYIWFVFNTSVFVLLLNKKD